MDIKTLDNPPAEIAEFFDNKISEFNLARWDIKEKVPLAVVVNGTDGNLVGGVSAKTFGNWLLIDNLWIAESERGKDLGTKILMQLEEAARNRGCRYSMLDTLDFQARPFYEKNGYTVQWVQEQYPTTGAKYFMIKSLDLAVK